MSDFAFINVTRHCAVDGREKMPKIFRQRAAELFFGVADITLAGGIAQGQKRHAQERRLSPFL